MTTFADQVGVARRNADLDADAVTYRMWDARLDRELSPTEKLTALGHGANFGFGEVAAIAAELGETASIYDGAQVSLDRHGLGGDARRQAACTRRWRGLSKSGFRTAWTRSSGSAIG